MWQIQKCPKRLFSKDRFFFPFQRKTHEKKISCSMAWTLRVINAPTMNLIWEPLVSLWCHHSPLACPPQQPFPCTPQPLQQPHYPPQPYFYSALTAWSVCQSKFVREGSDVPGILQPPGPSGGRQLSGTRLSR